MSGISVSVADMVPCGSSDDLKKPVYAAQDSSQLTWFIETEPFEFVRQTMGSHRDITDRSLFH